MIRPEQPQHFEQDIPILVDEFNGKKGDQKKTRPQPRPQPTTTTGR